MTRFDHEETVDVIAVGAVEIPTRDSRRAVRFYSRVFGFELVSTTLRNGSPRVLLRAQRCSYLALDEHGDAIAEPKRLRFETVSLDTARERLWNLGVVPADGSIEPRFDAARCRRIVPIRDPDGNEIELIESRPVRICRERRQRAAVDSLTVPSIAS